MKIKMYFSGSFIDLEAAFGQVYGVITTGTGYFGGALRKPAYREVIITL